MNKILFVITTYNQLEYTKLCIDSLSKIKYRWIDILVIDDFSTDGTQEWCKENKIDIFEKDRGRGLTHSWNVAYHTLKDNKDYKYLIISNNDILVPDGALEELVEVYERWPFSLVSPMTSMAGAGHCGYTLGLENVHSGAPSGWVNDPNNYQEVQDQLLANKEKIKKSNNLFMLDPVRIKMFNGFLFMMNRNVINYERKDGVLFDPTKIMLKAEDEFNWAQLIPNNDFPAVCKTSFVFHFKGATTNEIENYKNLANDPNLYFKARGKKK
jgi:GT2 family glycosyltransferase